MEGRPWPDVPPQIPAADLARLSPEMEFVPLRLGEALYESGAQLRHVYFPVSGVVSLLITTENGGTAEIAVIGNDGCVGIALLLGGQSGRGPVVKKEADRLLPEALA